MKKIACLSALACALTLSVGTASAVTSTVTGGYAQGDMQGQQNKAKGFNLKYRYENESPLGYIGSLTYSSFFIAILYIIASVLQGSRFIFYQFSGAHNFLSS